MIKIIRAREVPDIDDNGEVTGYEVVVEVDIDGIRTIVGGIDPKLSKEDVLVYLESKREEIVATAKANRKYQPVDRPALVGKIDEHTV